MTDKMREQFDAWVMSQVENGHFYGGYTEGEYDLAWSAWISSWEASRSAVVITLPDARDYSDDESAYQAIRDCETQIHLAGLETDDGYDD